LEAQDSVKTKTKQKPEMDLIFNCSQGT